MRRGGSEESKRRVTLKCWWGAGVDSRVLGDSERLREGWGGRGGGGGGGLTRPQRKVWWRLDLVVLWGEVKRGGGESTNGTLNKVTKVIRVPWKTCLGGRGWRLDVGLSGEAEGWGSGGRGGGGGCREGGGGAYGPLKVSKLVTVLAQSCGVGVSGDRGVWWRWFCKNEEIMMMAQSTTHAHTQAHTLQWRMNEGETGLISARSETVDLQI